MNGTDFRIREPYPFDKNWFSHKFKGLGLCYEVGISIIGGHIVWANGPFPCGQFPDLNMFRRDMKSALDVNEQGIAYGGYTDSQRLKYGETDEISKLFATVQARHEIVNRRFKQFSVLSNRFRQSLQCYSQCFHAVCNPTELMIENEEPLFNVV